MRIQDLCIDQTIGELSQDLLDLSKISSRKTTPLHTPHSPALTTISHEVRASSTTTKKACRKKKYPIHKKSYVVSQSKFVRIAPKLYPSDQPRHTRSCPCQHEPSPPRDRSPHAGALFRTEPRDTQGMTEADLRYMRMTPAERVAFKLPGTFVFQAQKRKQLDPSNAVYQLLTYLATPTKEIVLPNECSYIPSRRIAKKGTNFCDFIATSPQPQSLPPYSRLLEHALCKEVW
jgi:hypothetical protein